MRLGVSAVLVGLVLFFVGRLLDGFVAGFCQGAAVALLLLGVLVMSRARRGAGWLPSRDGEDR